MIRFTSLAVNHLQPQQENSPTATVVPRNGEGILSASQGYWREGDTQFSFLKQLFSIFHLENMYLSQSLIPI